MPMPSVENTIDNFDSDFELRSGETQTQVLNSQLANGDFKSALAVSRETGTFVEPNIEEVRFADIDINALEYIASHTDLSDALGADASAGFNHYNSNGADEGRTVTFDAEAYLSANSDLQVAFGEPSSVVAQLRAANHFIDEGRFQNRPLE